MTTLERLGFYTLAGAPRSPRELVAEVQDGERLGLGWVFISERFNIKEASTISGAVGAVSSRADERVPEAGSRIDILLAAHIPHERADTARQHERLVAVDRQARMWGPIPRSNGDSIGVERLERSHRSRTSPLRKDVPRRSRTGGV